MSLLPADTTTARGFAVGTSRNATSANSARLAPPTPRLMAFSPGKSPSSVFHIRMFEDPRNTTPPGDGGCSLSAFSKAAISFSHRTGGGTAACGAGSATGTTGAGTTGAGIDVDGAEGFRVGADCFFSSGRAKIRFQSVAIRTTLHPYFSAASSESFDASP